MKGRLYTVILGFAGLLCGMLSVAGKDAVTLRTHAQESRLFSVIGEDIASVSFVSRLAEDFERRAPRYLALPESFPQRIVVILSPDWNEERTPRYQVSVSGAGFVTARIHWTEQTRMEDVTAAVAEALLVRLAFYEFGASGPARLPAWFVSALGHFQLVSLRPEISTLAAERSLQSSKAFESLWKVSGPDKLRDQEFREESFWLLRAIFETLNDASHRRNFFGRVLAGQDLTSQLATFVRPRVLALSKMEAMATLDELARETGEDASADNDEEAAPTVRPELDEDTEDAQILQAWWTRERSRFALSRRPRFENPEDSRLLLTSLSELQIAGLEEGISRAPLRRLWEKRDDPDVRRVVEARLTLLATRMEQINPAYFNAGRSLGVLYNTVLREDRFSEFIRALTAFLTDFDDAKSVERDLIQALNALEG